MAAETIESDLELAFRLQFQEAINASLALHPSTSSSSSSPRLPGPLSDDVLKCPELEQLEQELNDLKISQSEFRKMRDDLHRRIHDQKFAMEIQQMPDHEWDEIGNEYANPFGEGSSNTVNNEVFRLYCKGLVEKSLYSDDQFYAIGVAICNSRDEVLMDMKKPLDSTGMNKRCGEINAIIEGLVLAQGLQLDRVEFYCDSYPVFQLVSGRWKKTQHKITTLLDQLKSIKGKFTYCQAIYAARSEIKYAFKLARDAITSQNTKAAESSNSQNLHETCVICLEDINITQIFSVDTCLHRYCYSCMKQHVEAKLLLGILPKCPHEKCKSELTVEKCSKFLTPKLIEIMGQRVKEASIPVSEKVYCPYPKCSALMSKTRLSRAKVRCMECRKKICVVCNVPWHVNMNCKAYKMKYPNGNEEELKLKSLAENNLWQQCVKCNHMIELTAGCYHMTCRCGYEFCYTCRAEWKNKKATCECPLFEFEDDTDDDDEDYEDEDYNDYSEADSDEEDYNDYSEADSDDDL